MRPMRVLGVLLVVMTLALAACGPKPAPSSSASPSTSPSPSSSASPAPAAQPTGWDAVLAAAKKEGTVTVYSTWGQKTSDVLKAGMKPYGIDVQVISGNGGALELKIATEQNAKAYTADLFAGGWSNQVNVVNAGNGGKTSVALPVLADKSVFKQSPDKYLADWGVYLAGTQLTPSVIINTDMIKAGDITSWQDLLDPKYKGQLVMTDPRPGSGPGTSGLGFWSGKLGDDFFKKLAAQNPVLYIQYQQVVDAVVHGDKPVGIFPAFSSTLTAIRAGAPLRMINVKEGTSYPLQGVALVKNAPHPNAALVLLNWYFTKEGQTAIQTSLDSYTLRKDVTESWLLPDMNPANFTMLEPPNNLDTAVTKKGTDLGKQLFK